MWVCCVNYGCNDAYDVTNYNDTQRNVHLAQHHILGVRPLYIRDALHSVRVGKMEEANAAADVKKMPVYRLVQLRVARFFIKKMMPFTVCEDRTYPEQESLDWKTCSRDTM